MSAPWNFRVAVVFAATLLSSFPCRAQSGRAVSARSSLAVETLPAPLRTGAAAQDSQFQQEVRAPLLGYVRDGTGSFRRIAGIPGAASLSAPVALGISAARLVFAQEQDSAYGVTAQEGRPFRVVLSSATPQPELFDAAPPGATEVVAGPGGTAAAFFYPEGPRVLVVSDAVAPSPTFRWQDLPPDADGSRIAINDEGSTLLFAEAGRSLFAVEGGAPPRLIPGIENTSAVTFLRNSTDIVVADSVLQSVFLLRDAGQATAETLLREADGLRNIAALVPSPDNRYVFAAGLAVESGGREVAAINIQDRSLFLTNCGCNAGVLLPLRQPGIYLLDGSLVPGRPLWAYENHGGRPELFFVPGLTTGGEGESK